MLGLATTAAVAGVLAPGAEAQTYHTKPLVGCTTYFPGATPAASVITRFTYHNTKAVSENIPVGDFNYVEPDPYDRGQPAQFTPGLRPASFEVTSPAAQPLAWVIEGVYALRGVGVDSLRFDTPCPDRGAQVTSVVPTALRAGAADQRLTIFGQRLRDVAVAATGGGVTVDPVQDSAQRLDLKVTVAPGADTSARDLLFTDPAGVQVGCQSCLALDAPSPDPGPQGPAGPAGAAGLSGLAGPPGRDGARGANPVVRATGAAKRFSRRNRTASATATCPAGTSVVSGGHEVTRGGKLGTLSVVADRPTDARRWKVTVRAARASSVARLRAYATCT